VTDCSRTGVVVLERRRGGRPRIRGSLITLLSSGVVLLLSGCRVAIGGDTDARPQSVLEPAGPVAEIQDRAWGILFPVATVVLVLVAGALAWLMWRYRDRGGEGFPTQTADHRVATKAWLAGTIVLLGAVKISTYMTAGEAVGFEPRDDALDVRVVAKQYWWEFEYTDRVYVGLKTANELHIPTGRDIAITMESLAADIPDAGAGNNEGAVLDGVIHSFWVPKLGGKLDVIPGTTRTMVIHADEPGIYPGQCAEFCGLAHAQMRFTVHAHAPEDFEAWVEQQTEPFDLEALDGVAVAGSEVFVRRACIECHSIRGFTADDGFVADLRVGPDLTKFNSRETFAGGAFEVSDDEQLADWIRDPAAVKRGAQMPTLGLSEREISTLIAFLRSLE
jgi:cytochrome c oxidase subunit II